MSGRVMVETERLILREFTEDDAEGFYRLNSNRQVMRYLGDPMLTSVEHALEVLRNFPLADYRLYGYGRWAVVPREGGELIGFAGLKYMKELEEVDLGYRLLPEWWGAGLATEAGRACVAYGRETLGLRRIIGMVDPENGASVRVLEKCGLVFEGWMEFRGARVGRYAVV